MRFGIYMECFGIDVLGLLCFILVKVVVGFIRRGFQTSQRGWLFDLLFPYCIWVLHIFCDTFWLLSSIYCNRVLSLFSLVEIFLVFRLGILTISGSYPQKLQLITYSTFLS